jgi:hypothetical protein
MAGMPGTKVTRVPAVIAAASSRVMNSGDFFASDIAQAPFSVWLSFVRVVAKSLRTGFDTIHKGEDHLFATHFTEYGIEEIEQSENHDAFTIEVYGGVKVVAYRTDISRTILQGAVNTKVMDDAKCGDHNPISALLNTFEMPNAT